MTLLYMCPTADFNSEEMEQKSASDFIKKMRNTAYNLIRSRMKLRSKDAAAEYRLDRLMEDYQCEQARVCHSMNATTYLDGVKAICLKIAASNSDALLLNACH